MKSGRPYKLLQHQLVYCLLDNCCVKVFHYACVIIDLLLSVRGQAINASVADTGMVYSGYLNINYWDF